MADETKPGEDKPEETPEKEAPLLTVEQILPKPRTSKIYLPSKQGIVEIQNITYGDLGLIYRRSKEDAFEFGMGVIVRGVKNPKLGWENIKALDPQDATLLVTEIMNLSGFTPRAAEEAKKYLRPT